jgi:hypothetical protein
MGQTKLGMIQLVEGATKVHDHEIAFVAEQRKERAGFLFVLFQSGKRRHRPIKDMLLIGGAERSPCRPADAEHLV